MRELYWTVLPKSKRADAVTVSIANRGKTARSAIRVSDRTVVRQLRTGFALSNDDIKLLRWLGKNLDNQKAIDALAACKFVHPIKLYNDTDPQCVVTVFRQVKYFPCQASILVNGAAIACVAISKNLVNDILCVTLDPFQYYDTQGNLRKSSGMGVFQVPASKVISISQTEKQFFS